MQIATINIWGRAPSWEARREILADNLAGLDVICLQEVYKTSTSDQSAELAHRLDMAHRAIDFRGGEGVAILSRNPLSDIEWFDLEDGGGFPRLAVSAQVSDETGPLTVISSHVSFVPQAIRARQADQLLGILSECERGILAADFNSPPDQLRLTKDMALAPINEPTWPEASREEIIASLPEKRSLFDLTPAQIDHLVGKNITWTAAEVIAAKQQSISGSDHAIVIGAF